MRLHGPGAAGGPGPLTIDADLYALGCILFHPLTGHPPFAHRKSGEEKQTDHRKEFPADLRTLQPELPPDLGILVEWLLAKAPVRRLAEPRQLVDALAPLAAWADLAGVVQAVASRPKGPPDMSRTPPPPPPRPPRRWLAAGVALAGVAATVAVLVRLGRLRPEPPPTSSKEAFELNDELRGGLQGFVLVASRQSLVGYGVWRQG